MDTFQMTLKLRLFTVEFYSNLYYNIVRYAVSAPFELVLNFP